MNLGVILKKASQSFTEVSQRFAKELFKITLFTAGFGGFKDLEFSAWRYPNQQEGRITNGFSRFYARPPAYQR